MPSSFFFCIYPFCSLLFSIFFGCLLFRSTFLLSVFLSFLYIFCMLVALLRLVEI
eukprot:UN09739